jgi:hypothetical protein
MIGLGCWGDNGNRYAFMLSQASALRSRPSIRWQPSSWVAWLTIISPNMLNYGFDRYFPDAVMSAGGGEHMDIQNIHYFTDFRLEWERWNTGTPTCGDVDDGQGDTYYGGGIDVIAKANHYKNRMLVCHGVDKPLWITEIAASSGRPGEETTGNHDLDWQARYVPQVYARSISIGVGNVTWYGLTTPNQQHDEQGLLFADFSPKPSFTAYQTMTAQLSRIQLQPHAQRPRHRGLCLPRCSRQGQAFTVGAGNEHHRFSRIQPGACHPGAGGGLFGK